MTRRPKIKQIVREVYDARAAGARCGECSLAASCKPVRPRGATSEAPRLAVVDSYPSGPADRLGHFTQTTSSRFLDKNLDSAGADGAYFTYALLCRPPKGTSAEDVDKAVEACRPRLERELDEHIETRRSLGGSDVGHQRGESLGLARGLLDSASTAPRGRRRIAEISKHPTTPGFLDEHQEHVAGILRRVLAGVAESVGDGSLGGANLDSAPRDGPTSGYQVASVWTLALDEIAFQATTGKVGLEAWRGSPIDAYRERGGRTGAQAILRPALAESGHGVTGVFRSEHPADTHGAEPAQRVIPTWGPGAVLAKDGRRYGRVFYRHVERAWMLATGQLADFSWGEIVVNAPRAALQKIEAIAHAGGEYAADIETGGLGLKVPLNCIGFAVAGLAVSVSVPYESAEVETLVRSILRRGVMVTQNGALFDRPFLEHKGYELTPRHEDCLLASSILTPQLPKGLAFQASSEFHSEAHKSHYRSDQESGTSLEAWADSRELREYNAKDCVVTYLLWQTQKKKLEEYV